MLQSLTVQYCLVLENEGIILFEMLAETNQDKEARTAVKT
jgi:hypothetical protein